MFTRFENEKESSFILLKKGIKQNPNDEEFLEKTKKLQNIYNF